MCPARKFSSCQVSLTSLYSLSTEVPEGSISSSLDLWQAGSFWVVECESVPESLGLITANSLDHVYKFFTVKLLLYLKLYDHSNVGAVGCEMIAGLHGSSWGMGGLMDPPFGWAVGLNDSLPCRGLNEADLQYVTTYLKMFLIKNIVKYKRQHKEHLYYHHQEWTVCVLFNHYLLSYFPSQPLKSQPPLIVWFMSLHFFVKTLAYYLSS